MTEEMNLAQKQAVEPSNEDDELSSTRNGMAPGFGCHFNGKVLRP